MREADAPRRTASRDHAERDVPHLARRRRRRARFATTRPRSARAWSCSTRSTRSRPSRRRDLAVRWNCKAGKCGSCSAEINGKPKLMCMTRLDELDLDEPVTVEPMRAFPPIRDLVTDVSWNFRVKKAIKPFKPRKPDAPDGTWRMEQATSTACRSSGSASSASCARTSATSCATTTSTTSSSARGSCVYAAALEMHPLDTEDRLGGAEGGARHRLLQHHQVLHEGLPRAHHDHRQRDHPAQGAGGGSSTTIR